MRGDAGFAFDAGLVFLNHGSFGARPLELLAEAELIRRRVEANPVELLSRASSGLLDEAAAALGGYVGALPSNLAFVENATTAVNVAARSLELGPGDEVLASDHEYGACELAWERVCEARGASYRSFPLPLPYRGDGDFLERLESAMSPATRVLFLSHVTSPTALRLPVEEACALARGRGIATVVDGAHGPGQLSLDLEGLGADFYAGDCHKWMCAPLGTGFLYARPERHEAIEPPVASWGLVAEAEGTEAHDGYVGTGSLARRLRWLGTRDLAGFLSVPAALRYLRGLAASGDAERCSRLARATARRAAEELGLDPLLQEGATEAAGLRMALVPLPAGVDAPALQYALFDRFRIEVPVTSHGDGHFLRLSFFAYNDESDGEALVDALRRLFKVR